MRTLRSRFFLAVLIAAPPTRALAQSTITGVVADASNSVLPGVTVEASSPVLIEKARTVVTDGTGQYRIVDLPAGTYTVTFVLAGFATVKREGIRLIGSFSASVNAQLSLGALEETVTVTGESPIVDVQGSKVQRFPARRVRARSTSTRRMARAATARKCTRCCQSGQSAAANRTNTSCTRAVVSKVRASDSRRMHVRACRRSSSYKTE
jgi:hypothetical protein